MEKRFRGVHPGGNLDLRRRSETGCIIMISKLQSSLLFNNTWLREGRWYIIQIIQIMIVETFIPYNMKKKTVWNTARW